MSHKVNPIGFRTGIFLPWKSRWYADKTKFANLLVEDIKIRKNLMDRLKIAGITSVEIERLPKSMVVNLTVSRPGVVIGRGGSGIEETKKVVVEIVRKVRGTYPKDLKIDLRVAEVKNPELSAHLVASRIASELERRMPHRRVVTRAMERVIQSGGKGIKIMLSGRIGGAEIARSEKYHLGSVPTQTLRENIDFARVPALLTRGYVGIKVWIFKETEK
ncbi:30S ribosomal protein S3 [Candidatus Woesebacteria bacterium RIFOXYB1_FULL_38_16]|uniref:Small ribosomal subunit protein uS3 n=1 Tax=Candidatus Woesebacteria bacterium RIFOXYB1_FULL_38_16 TaxID=1802538 RepID=A0A1F8CUQ4_9BACT|nr:MAG: 30S ribosomal protein S3 [Candidatus Woesebacteria bacterium RIFOXYA1_FULL_38_9]OGM80044.1 MAG: 30S ribosomal protein S3 [Candidatus Woesebacteria bacterium RIFOXYB1_FULL_38_16]